MKPYYEEHFDKYIIRTFSQDVKQEDLVWHRDHNDRTVKVIYGPKWKFQFDNDMPFDLKPGMEFDIPKNTYHRLIKGDATLQIRIEENV